MGFPFFLVACRGVLPLISRRLPGESYVAGGGTWKAAKDMATVEAEEGRQPEKRPKTASSPPSSHPVTKATGGDGAGDGSTLQGAHEKPSSKLSSNGGSGENKKGSREVLTFTIDPDVLRCANCSEELTRPIFQVLHSANCSKELPRRIFQHYTGGFICSSCRRFQAVDNCPSCKSAIICRNLGIEKILESIKVPCPYASSGCEQLISYLNIDEHRKMCEYSPCCCPAANCNFEAPMRELYHHFVQGHPGDRSISFQYNRAFRVDMGTKEHFRVVHGDDGVLFLLLNIINETEFRMGYAVMVACLGPDSMEGEYTYRVKARDEEQVSSVQLKSPMSNIRRWEEDFLPENNFLLIPQDFRGSCSCLYLEITIWN